MIPSPLVGTLLASLALGGGAFAAQTTVSSTRVLTDPAGGSFYVDGQRFGGPATFLWPAGSKHLLNIDPVEYAPLVKTRYVFAGWKDSTGLLAAATTQVVVTADLAITFYQASLTVEHAVSLNFFTCPNPDPATCGGPGTVFVNGTAYLVNTDIYLPAGVPVTLQAVPNPGFVFVGWLDGLGNTIQAFLNSFVLDRPVFVFPRFAQAREVTIQTSPPGLEILADRTTLHSPATLDWGLETTHTLGVVTPQRDLHGRVWVFDSWSDGGAETHAFTMPSQTTGLTVTANFVSGGRATFLTNPPGLELQIDGRSNWPTYSFSWAAGAPHTVSAPQQQTDRSGRSYRFQSWSNGGPATQNITLSAADVASGFRLTANYEPWSQTVIQTAPSGMGIQIDGTDCQTPCPVERPIGTSVHVTVPAVAPVSEDTRLEFDHWSDGAAPDRILTLALEPLTLTATYRYCYRLGLSADPPEGAQWRLDPASPDRFYAAPARVMVVWDPRPGYRFRRWDGDASGTSRAVAVEMSAARNVRAILDRIPYIAPAGVRNAAGETPRPAVAPGSIAAIYGESLAPQFELGPESPLAQTLADVTVVSGDRLLPLFFVSPEQINVQLPSDLSPGDQTLTVHWEGHPEVTADFRVERDAPGLFYRQIDDQHLAVVTHQDGSLVTPESPARHGERVTAYGTGFGPYQAQPLDGFAAPDSPRCQLLDRVELVIGDKVIQPEYAGAAPGRVGVTAIGFRIDDSLPASAAAEMKVRIQDAASNTVLLLIE